VGFAGHKNNQVYRKEHQALKIGNGGEKVERVAV